MSSKLGIDTKGMSKEQIQALEKSVSNLLDVNKLEQERTMGATIERRGDILPGDTGDRFGTETGFRENVGALDPFGFLGLDALRLPGLHEHGHFGHSGLVHGIQGSYVGFSKQSRIAKRKMALAVSAYRGFGIAKNVIDLMANFAAEGLTIKHKNKTTQRFYERWAQHVDIVGRVKDILRYYYKYGNVFIYTVYGKISKKVYDKLRRARAKLTPTGKIPDFREVADTLDPQEENRQKKAEKEAQKPIDERQIPWRYRLLNPFQMELVGTKFFGESRWVFVVDEETAGSVKQQVVRAKNASVDFLDDTEVNLPPEFKKFIDGVLKAKTQDELADPRVVPIDQERLWTMHYMKDDHEDWADPMLWPVMGDIFYKNKLRRMDMSVCNSVINAVTIYKLGMSKEGFVPSSEQLRQFAEFLRTPTQAMNMVWNDAIDIVDSYPPVDKILSMEKYEAVDRDILRGIGIPDSLLGGSSSSNFSNGFLGVRTLLERLEEGRNTVVRWLNKQLQLIATTMGHKTLPTIKFGKMSLRDEVAEKKLIMGLLDRNIISAQSVVEAFGEDFEIELERMREEKKLREDEDLLKQHGPFTDPMNNIVDEEVMDESQQKDAKRPPSRKQRPNGRPPNTKDIQQEVNRETKPQGMANFILYEKEKARILNRINKLEEIIAAKVIEKEGHKSKRSLTKAQANGIENTVYTVASNMSGDEVNSHIIWSTLNESKRVDKRIYNHYTSMIDKNSTLEDRKSAMASAIAMVRIGE